ncbi:MAG: substrate-binding domain-containing protein [Terriglobia bacterium]
MKRIGVEDIAHLANVSIGTVDRALHGRKEISEITRKRILRIAQEHGYHPNMAARALSVGKPSIRIGVCLPQEVHYFFDQVRDGFMSEARRYKELGVEVLYRPYVRLGVGEQEKMEGFLHDRPHVLAVCPGHPQTLAPLISQAEENNIRVICVSTDAPGTARSGVVSVDPAVSGHLAGELMSRLLLPNSGVAVVTGLSATEDHRKKVQAFSEMFVRLSPTGRLVEVVEGHDDEDETFQKVYDFLRRHQSVEGLYVSTANCLPVCHAVGAHGLHSKIKVIATDLFKEMVPYFQKGTIVASIHQRPYVQGQIAVRLAVDYVANGRPIPPTYYLNPHIVMQSNMHLFRELRHDRIRD